MGRKKGCNSVPYCARDRVIRGVIRYLVAPLYRALRGVTRYRVAPLVAHCKTQHSKNESKNLLANAPVRVPHRPPCLVNRLHGGAYTQQDRHMHHCVICGDHVPSKNLHFLVTTHPANPPHLPWGNTNALPSSMRRRYESGVGGANFPYAMHSFKTWTFHGITSLVHPRLLWEPHQMNVGSVNKKETSQWKINRKSAISAISDS